MSTAHRCRPASPASLPSAPAWPATPPVAISDLPERISHVSGPRDPRHPRPEDNTVDVPLRPPSRTDPVPAEEPWWKNANSRVAPPPRVPPPRPPEPRAPGRDRPSAPASNRHAKPTPRRDRGQLALLIGVGVVTIAAALA